MIFIVGHQKDKVLAFIKNFKFTYEKELEYVFTSGNCYHFAVILSKQFKGDIYYLPCTNHFVCKIGTHYYDITGVAPMNESPIDWEKYQLTDPVHSRRIIRDCVNFDTRDKNIY